MEFLLTIQEHVFCPQHGLSSYKPTKTSKKVELFMREVIYEDEDIFKVIQMATVSYNHSLWLYLVIQKCVTSWHTLKYVTVIYRRSLVLGLRAPKAYKCPFNPWPSSTLIFKGRCLTNSFFEQRPIYWKASYVHTERRESDFQSPHQGPIL